MPGHGHRDGNIDTHHADLNAATKLTRDVSIAGVARHAIAKLMGVDEIDSLCKILDSNITDCP